MISKNSLYKIFKVQNKISFPLIISYTLGYFLLFTMPVIFETLNYKGLFNFFPTLTPLTIIITAVIAFVSALNSFGYLFNKNEIIYTHSLPISRLKLYLLKFFSGFAYFISAFLINILLVWIFNAIFAKVGVMDSTKGMTIINISYNLCKMIILSIIAYFIANNICTFAIMVASNHIINIIATVVLVVLPLYIGVVISEIEHTYYLTDYITQISNIYFISPLALIIYLFSIENLNMLFEVIFTNIPLLYLVIILPVINYYLYKNRKLERINGVFAYDIIGNIFKIITEVFLAIGVGIVIFNSNNMIIAFFSLIPIYLAVELITTFDISSIKRNKNVLIISAILILAITLGFESNMFLLNPKFPAYKDIATMHLSTTNYDSMILNRGVVNVNKNYYNMIEDLYSMRETDVKVLKSKLKPSISYSNEEDYVRVLVQFYLKNNLTNKYIFIISKDNLNTFFNKYLSDTADKSFIYSDILESCDETTEISIVFGDNHDEYAYIGKVELKLLLDTYTKEFAKHRGKIVTAALSDREKAGSTASPETTNGKNPFNLDNDISYFKVYINYTNKDRYNRDYDSYSYTNNYSNSVNGLVLHFTKDFKESIELIKKFTTK